MKAIQISRPGGEFELVNKNIPEPSAGHVRVKKTRFGVVLEVAR